MSVEILIEKFDDYLKDCMCHFWHQNSSLKHFNLGIGHVRQIIPKIQKCRSIYGFPFEINKKIPISVISGSSTTLKIFEPPFTLKFSEFSYEQFSVGHPECLSTVLEIQS